MPTRQTESTRRTRVKHESNVRREGSSEVMLKEAVEAGNKIKPRSNEGVRETPGGGNERRSKDQAGKKIFPPPARPRQNLKRRNMPCMKCRLTCEADAGTLGTQRYQKQGGATSELGGDSGNVRTCTVCGQWGVRETERQRRI